MERLDLIKKQINSLEKLKIADAKNLYIEAISTKDINEYKAIMNRIINGTLYVIYDFIDRNGLSILNGANYDTEDLFNTLTEMWIKSIKEGELLNIERYSEILFSYRFIHKVKNLILGPSSLDVGNQYKINRQEFIELFKKYVDYKNKGIDFNVEEVLGSKNIYTQKLIIMFENIYKNLNFDKTDDLDMAYTKIFNLLDLLIDRGLYEDTIDSYSYNLTDGVIDKVTNEEFRRDLKDALTTEEIELLYKIYGIDDSNERAIKKVAKELNVSCTWVTDRESKILRKLRYSPKIKSYK